MFLLLIFSLVTRSRRQTQTPPTLQLSETGPENFDHDVNLSLVLVEKPEETVNVGLQAHWTSGVVQAHSLKITAHICVSIFQTCSLGHAHSFAVHPLQQPPQNF